MKSQKKQIISFLTIMFITLLCCSLVSATDTTDTTTTTTTHKEVTNTQNVEQTQTNNNIGTTISTQNNIQSDENNIGENDQNEVEDEQNNTKAINKAKMAQTNVKTADSIIQLSSWNQIVNAKSGVFNLTRNIQATSTVTLTGPITIYGNDFTITGTGVNDLFNAGSYAVNLNDLTITGLNGYVINGGTNHHILSSIFDNNGGFGKWIVVQHVT